MPGPCIKLTDEYGRTRRETFWRAGEWNPDGVKDGAGGLCTRSYYHAYDAEHPATALLLNPIHANIARPRVWVAEWRGARADDRGLKMGATEMRVVRELAAEVPTTIQRVAFAILVTRLTADATGRTLTDEWLAWADAWMPGEDRTRESARRARIAAYATATTAAAYAAAYAADAAAAADDAAAYAAATASTAAAYAAATDADMREILAHATAWALTID